MSVTVEKAGPYRRCNSCNSNGDVIEITLLKHFGNIKQGVQIALCESCAQKLRFALNNRYEGYGEQDDE